MRRGHASGVLLVEAVISAVVIAIALAFITRGLSSQLHTLARLEEYQTVLNLAGGKLQELEGQVVPDGALTSDFSGTFDDPYTGYQWEVTSAPRPDLLDENDSPLASDITLIVDHEELTSASIRLGAVWLREWLP